jgi:hypothetical protein
LALRPKAEMTRGVVAMAVHGAFTEFRVILKAIF